MRFCSVTVGTPITEIKAGIKAQTARIDILQRVIWRVIWPLIVLLAVPVFGLLSQGSHYPCLG